jgi:FMN phosphatase YigB (HAD superfamily)
VSVFSSVPDRWLLVDLGNVLVPFDHTRVAAGLARFRRADAPAADLHDFIFGADAGESPRNSWMDHGRRPDGAPYGLSELADDLRRGAGVAVTDDELRVIWNSIFDPPFPGVAEFLESMHVRGLHLAIASNTNLPHWEFIVARWPEAVRRIERPLLSCDLHVTKADPAFFRRVAEITGSPLEHHLLIDDLDANLIAARSVGMRAWKAEGPEWPRQIGRVVDSLINSSA